jgi:hypothetical protein
VFSETLTLLNLLFKYLCLVTNDGFYFVGGDSIKVDESLFQDLEELDLDADEVLDDSS